MVQENMFREPSVQFTSTRIGMRTYNKFRESSVPFAITKTEMNLG